MLNLTDTENLRLELVNTICFLHGKGWAPATSSNYSFREPKEKMYWISKSGIDKQLFTEEDLMLIYGSGEPVYEIGTKSSAEMLLHTLIYEDETVSCVLHTHSVYNTVLSRVYLDKRQIVLTDYEMIKAIKGFSSHEERLVIPIFQNSQDIKNMSDDIRKFRLQNSDMRAFLIAGHGLYTWGETISVAKRQVEAIEFMLECLYKEQILTIL